MIDLAPYFIALAAAVPGVYAVRQSRRAQDKTIALEETKVDREAYTVAMNAYTTAISTYRAELERANSDKKFLEMRISELEREVGRLRRRMREVGIDMPEELPGN